ncbi:MAG: copper-binding protein [Sphingomonas sp.]
MKMTVPLIAATGALALLAGCGPKAADKTDATAANAAAPAMAMPAPGVAQAGKIVKGVGEVTAIDAAAGKITLKHEAIPDAGWPAMTMAFTAAPPIVAKARVGEKVAIDLKLGAVGGEVTAIGPR